jgi:hypothetical protein
MPRAAGLPSVVHQTSTASQCRDPASMATLAANAEDLQQLPPPRLTTRRGGTDHQPSAHLPSLQGMTPTPPRRSTRAAAVALVAATSAVIAGTTTPAGSFPLRAVSASHKVAPNPVTPLTAEFRRHIDSDRTSNVVVVPGGEEAASWLAPKRQTIRFWRRSHHSEWHVIGHSHYPNIAGRSCRPKISGRDLSRTRHAVYILLGCFTGDGVVNQAAFAHGPHGWGLVEPVSRTRMASLGHGGTRKHPHYRSLYRAMEFRHGRLVTVVGNTSFFDDGDDTRYPFVTDWRRSGGAFDSVRNNAFFAHTVPSPARASTSLPAGRCPRNGTFRASFGARIRVTWPAPVDAPVRLLAFPLAQHYPRHPACQQPIRPRTPITVMAAHTTAHKYYLHHGRITNRRWITAPAWFLLVPDFIGYEKRIPLAPGSVHFGNSPYVVPRSFGVNEMLTDLGRPETYSRKHGWRRAHQPAHGTVTLHRGHVVSLWVKS